MMGSAPAIPQLADVVPLLVLGFALYVILYKSPLALFWWPLVAWALEPLGFRMVCMDRSFGIYAIRWSR